MDTVSPTGHDANAVDDQHDALMLTSMISMTRSVITGGVFNQTHVHRFKTPIEQLQEEVTHSAFHNSAQRIDAPRCHPNTRIVVKEKAYRWCMRSDTQSMNASILWLNGAAGGGKSAIAQSLAEQCYEENILLASFFFSRSDPSRSHVKHFIATMVYQIHQIVPPPIQDLICRAIEQDPLIWSRDIFTQFRILIVNPLTHIVRSGFFQGFHVQRVIIIDGLDECIDRLMQRKILELILKALLEWHLPFLFFIASRPEPEIMAMFERPNMVSLLFGIRLDEEYLPDLDIELFLRDKLLDCCITHPFRQYIPADWPSNNAIATLVRKSSGQFIYASVVVKYVTSTRHFPHRRLEVILNLRPTTDSPFAELDAVYSQILSSVDNLSVVQRIISFRLLFFHFTVRHIEAILDLEDGELPLAICDMMSLARIVPDNHDGAGGYLQILHASFEDYLFDASRSKHHHVDRAGSYYIYTKTFIAFIMSADFDDGKSDSVTICCNMLYCLPNCFIAVDLDSDISQHIMAYFSMYALCNRIGQARFVSQTLMHSWLRFSLPQTIRALDVSKSANAPTIRRHLLGDFDDFLSCHLNSYAKTSRFHFNVALISLVRTQNLIPRGVFYEGLRLDHDNLDSSKSADILIYPFQNEDTIKLISDYLCTPTRSHSHAVGPGTFSEAAIYCLRYLCRHGASSHTKIPIISHRQRLIRRMYPWKWNHRPFFEEVRGPGSTPWMWLNWPWERKTVLEPYRHDIIYAHLPLDDWASPLYDDSPVVYYRERSERYWLALHYLSLFLPAAGHSDTLIEMCKTKVFASKSQDFPSKSRRVRTTMKEYLERWGSPLY